MATDDDSDVPESGAVFTFGRSKFADNSPSKFWIRNDCVVHVACGDEHTTLLAESGRVFAFGANDWGQLGLGHTKAVTKPSCLKSLKKKPAARIGCGRQQTFIALVSGAVYSCGANGECQLGLGSEEDTTIHTPRQIQGLPDCGYKVLTGGTDHAAALTDDGCVYVWGSGSEGQLGLGMSQQEAAVPVQLELEEKVKSLSCGYYHTAVVTDGGSMYTFGETEDGKLGHGDTTIDNTEPTHVDVDDVLVSVSCGGSHTVALSEDGRAYSFGGGGNGQLGHGNKLLDTSSVQLITGLKDLHITSVYCGENHTAFVTDKGHLYTCGDGRHGKLGLGEENFANQFCVVPVQRFNSFTVQQVSCGGCHTLVLAKFSTNAPSDNDSNDNIDVHKPHPSKHSPPGSATMMSLSQKPGIADMLRRSEDMDLSGSFTARNRRREKRDPNGTLDARTLPPLNVSLSNRSSLPPLNASFNNGKPQHKPRRKGDHDVTKSLEINAHGNVVNHVEDEETNATAPPRTKPRHAKLEKIDNSDRQSESSLDSEEERKKAHAMPPKPKPRKVVNTSTTSMKSSTTSMKSEATSDAEDTDEQKRTKLKPPKPKRKVQSRSTDDEVKSESGRSMVQHSSPSEGEEEQVKPRKKKTGRKKSNMLAKRRGRRQAEKEEVVEAPPKRKDESDEQSDAESEEEKRKQDTSSERSSKRGKSVKQSIKKKQKEPESDEANENSEADSEEETTTKIKNSKKKQDKREDKDDVESTEEEESDEEQDNKAKKKSETPEKKKTEDEPKKKSRLCVVL